MPHYNTTHEPEKDLEGYQKQVASQDNRIANFFELYPGEIFTPWEIQSLVFTHPSPPITSVRRSMSDLTKAGILTKTQHKKEAGNYGRRSYAWILNERYRETLGVMQEILDPDVVQEPQNDEKPLPPILDPTEKRKPGNGAKTSPQGKLFDVPIVGSVICSICGRPLKDPKSIARGTGPICEGKCES